MALFPVPHGLQALLLRVSRPLMIPIRFFFRLSAFADINDLSSISIFTARSSFWVPFFLSFFFRFFYLGLGIWSGITRRTIMIFSCGMAGMAFLLFLFVQLFIFIFMCCTFTRAGSVLAFYRWIYVFIRSVRYLLGWLVRPAHRKE
jgi:hypothetical protein